MTGESKSEELRECPFCGSPAELERDSDHHGEWFNLGCSRHWGRSVDAAIKCPGGRIWYTAVPEELPAAISAWNRRAHVPAGAGEVKEVAITPDGLMDLLQGAYEAGCAATHKAIQSEPTLALMPVESAEFGEAAWDYVASLDFTESTRSLRTDRIADLEAKLKAAEVNNRNLLDNDTKIRALFAADAEVEALKSKLAAAKEALRPFHRAYNREPRLQSDRTDVRKWFELVCMWLAPSDFRHAAQTLKDLDHAR